MAEGHPISIPRTARYFTLGGAGAGSVPAEVLYALHGYGQLAEDFLGELAFLAGEDRLLVAPEGLSRFYLREGTGEVGASWMTKVARTDEIEDYVRYLDAVHNQVLALARDTRVHVLGFSQGVATAMRWAALGQTRVDRLTLWAGDVPPDLGDSALRLGAVDLTLVLGERDAVVDDTRLEESIDRLRKAGLTHRVVRFAGGHRLDDETLRRLI